MPRPPPPAAALTITGYPILFPHSSASASDRTTSEPGRTGRPSSLMDFLARFLSPINRTVSGDGPMKARLQVSQTSAKWGFSARKP